MSKKNGFSKLAGRTSSSSLTSLDDSSSAALEYFQNQDYRNCLEALANPDGNPAASIPTELIPAGAVSAYKLRRFAEGLNFVEAGLAHDSQDVNLLLLRVILFFEIGEYVKSIAAATHESLLQDNANFPVTLPGGTAEWAPRIHNAVGMSHYNLGNYTEAITLLNRAIATNPDFPDSYINLATVKARQGDIDGQRRAISDGLVHCADKRDLQKLATQFLDDERISLCMIVKNEEKMLEQCLDSVSELVDEIIVIDTGSTDRTVEIAKKFGAHVFHHPWEANFSLHRNQSISYATGDWILIMDADEVLTKEDHAKVRQATRIPDVNVISVSVHNQHLRTGDFTSFLPSVRMWRRKLNAHYEGIVHNELRLPASEPVLRADIRLIHYGYGLDWEQMKVKIARSKELLQKQLAENPNNAFANFNYSQILRGEHQTIPSEVCQEIIEHSTRAVQHTSPDVVGQRHIHLMALDQISSAYFFLKEYDRAAEFALRALVLEPSYLDALFALGHIYAGARDFTKAIQAYTKYIEAADRYKPGEETQNLILIHSADQASASFGLGLIHEETQQNSRAIEYFEQVVKYKEDHSDVHTHLAVLQFKAGNLDKAEHHAIRRIDKSPADVLARSILADIYRRQNRPAEAKAQCEKILEQNPANKSGLELMVLLEREAGNHTAALEYVGKLISNLPGDQFALTNKAELLMTQNRYQEAADVYAALSESYPQNPEYTNDAGNCYFKLQDYKSAVRCYSRALSLKPQFATALRNLGYTYFKMGEGRNALSRLSNYLDYLPDDFEITYLVARLCFDLADYNSAIRYVERCLTLQPPSAALIAFLADCYLKLGHYDSAKLGYQKALALEPGYQPARTMLSELDKVMKDQIAGAVSE